MTKPIRISLVVVWMAGCGGGAAGDGLSAPANLTAAPMGGGVHLTWTDNSPDEDGFDIERKVAQGNAGFAALDSVPFDSSVYHDAAVSPGTTYVYRVRAKRATTYSAYSNEDATDPGGGGGGGTTGAGGGGGTTTDSGGTTGTAGRGGATGSAGTTGAAGSGGRGGATGSAGSTGSAGRGGTTGTAGTTSAAGTTGRAGRGGTTGSGGAGGTSAATVSFRRDVVPSLVQTCGSTTAGCHNADQAVGRIMPQYGPCKVIWFSAVDAPVGATNMSGPNAGQATGCPDVGLYDRLLQLHSMLCDGSTWSARAKYVVPFDLQKSLIYQVIAGEASFGGKCSANGMPVTKMPKIDPAILPNGVPLTADRIQKIADWILQGAPNN